MAEKGRPTEYANLYNEKFKEEFLDNSVNKYRKATKNTYRKRLARFYQYEKNLGKDLYDFTPQELEDAFLDIGSKSSVGLTSIKSIVAAYKDYAIRVGASIDDTNITRLLDIDKISNMIDKISFRQKYVYGNDDLLEIVQFCKNGQDSACFILPYFGIRQEEMINLKTKEDIDFVNNTIKLPSGSVKVKGKVIEFGERIVEIPEIFMNYIKIASREFEYEVVSSRAVNTKPLPLQPSEYLLKNAVSPTKFKPLDEKLKKTKPTERIKRIGRELGRTLLTETTIFYSGVFNRLAELEKVKELTTEDYTSIRHKSGLYDDSNTSSLIRNYQQYKEAVQSRMMLEKIEEELKQEKDNQLLV